MSKIKTKFDIATTVYLIMVSHYIGLYTNSNLQFMTLIFGLYFYYK